MSRMEHNGERPGARAGQNRQVRNMGGRPSGAKTRRPVARKQGYFDYSLLFIVIFLCCFGLVMLYSTTAYTDMIAHKGDMFYTVKKQAVFMLLAFGVMLLVSRIDYHFWIMLAKYGYIISLVLSVAVIFVGKSAKGKARWFELGPISFQPAELVKIALIVALAAFLNKMYPYLKTVRVLLVTAFLVILLAIPVTVNNLSSGIIIMGIGFLMAFVASKQRWLFAAVIVVGLGAVVLAYQTGLLEHFLHGYQMDRINAWLNPTNYEKDEGYQILQGLYAIGSGGLFGRGLGQSVQKLGFLPEAQNDMIFGIICEELGLFGAVLVIALFVMMIWRFMFIANNAPDFTGSMLATGVMAHMAIQVLLNIAVVTNTMPNTGVTLPFISYGGTSLMFLMVEIGLVLNVSNQIQAKS